MMEDWFESGVLFWVISFFIDAALVGILMHQMICLSDLEHDFTNPHDFTIRINKLVMPEFILQLVHVLYLLMGGKWLSACMNLPTTIWNIRCFKEKQVYLEVTDVYHRLPTEKKVSAAKLGIYLLCMSFIMYRLVESAGSIMFTSFNRHRETHFEELNSDSMAGLWRHMHLTNGLV